MTRMNARLGRAFLCVLLLCLTVSAQKQIEYHTGVLDVRKASDASPDKPDKTTYLLHIRDSSTDYFALSNLKFRESDLTKATDVQYRISGKSLFVRVPEREEIKSRICEMPQFSGVTLGVKCGGKVSGSSIVRIVRIPFLILGVLAHGL
jgi:hypothetical protein